MKDLRVSVDKEKVILGVITAVALFCVGIGLASVLSDNKNYENNWNNVVDLGDANDDAADGDMSDDRYALTGDGLTEDGYRGGDGDYGNDADYGDEWGYGDDYDGGMAVNNGHVGVDSSGVASGSSDGMNGGWGTTGSGEAGGLGGNDSAGNGGVAIGADGSGSAGSLVNSAGSGEELAVAAGVLTDRLGAYTFSHGSALMWPVFGEVIMNYSMDSTILHKTLGVYKTYPAMSISAAIGDEVEAAASGIVWSIYESSETGTTVEIAVGSGYVTVYGLLDNLTVSEGDAVIAGQVIGTVGAPTAYYTEEGPNVYFAVTKDGEPADPMEFLVEQ